MKGFNMEKPYPIVKNKYHGICVKCRKLVLAAEGAIS